LLHKTTTFRGFQDATRVVLFPYILLVFYPAAPIGVEN
jgi:hypothetical protein